MDIRTQKTKRSIYNAFIELRSKKPLEKITVKELCEKAQINKSTFYVYYSDVYDLSDKIEDEVISEIMKSLSDTEEILADPALFCNRLFLAYTSQRSLINILFNGSRSDNLPRKIEYAIKDAVFTNYPQYKDDIDFNIRLTYSIYGGFYTYKEYSHREDEQIYKTIGELSGKVMNKFAVQ